MSGNEQRADREAYANAERFLGQPMTLPLGPGEPESGREFRSLATRHTFGDSWPRVGLVVRTSAQVSVTIAATLGTHEPLRGQLRIVLNNGVSKDEIVELFIHLEAYAGAARAFDSYQIALQVFAENGGPAVRQRPDPVPQDHGFRFSGSMSTRTNSCRAGAAMFILHAQEISFGINVADAR